MLPLLSSWGSAAEYVAVDEDLLAKVPPNVDLAAVAGIPTVALTIVQVSVIDIRTAYPYVQTQNRHSEMVIWTNRFFERRPPQHFPIIIRTL